ncbi:Gfo/Idh/MocA family protein [Haloarchaeobius sp. TZWSO28]|uniref:Gfo/Idh/MocA family protein n=1 Tax=Haloarchaeobius sp. TZWSO28 TaxID=3446119 RepID=UPI003EBB551A
MEEVRYGIVGCAGIGNTHAEAVAAAEGTELVACADLDADAANAFAAEHGVDAWYDDVTAMIDESEVDAVSVCTPSGTHADVTVEVADAGAHVLCEKPLDVYADRMSRMIDACDEAGVTLAGVFQKRFQPASQRAKAVVDDGDLGELVIADESVKWFRSQEYYDSGAWRGTRDMDGGVLLNQAIHGIDRLQWLMEGVASVQAATDTIGRDMECESVAAISLRFRNGAIGTISATTATKGGTDRTDINGTEGTLSLSGSEILSLETGTGEENHMNAATTSHDTAVEQFEWGDGHAAAVQDFVDALREDREPAVPGREARKAVDVILAAYASNARGESVSVDDVRDGHVPEANADSS